MLLSSNLCSGFLLQCQNVYLVNDWFENDPVFFYSTCWNSASLLSSEVWRPFLTLLILILLVASFLVDFLSFLILSLLVVDLIIISIAIDTSYRSCAQKVWQITQSSDDVVDDMLVYGF